MLTMLLIKCIDRSAFWRWMPIEAPPYTLSLFLAGFGLGVAGTVLGTGNRHNYDCHQGHGDNYYIVGWCAMHAARRLEPNVFTLLLLPPLIYESASKVDWFVFKRGINSIVYMAFPGVVVAAFGIALAFVYVSGVGETEWTFMQVREKPYTRIMGSVVALAWSVFACLTRHDMRTRLGGGLTRCSLHSLHCRTPSTAGHDAGVDPGRDRPGGSGGGAARAGRPRRAVDHYRGRESAERRQRHGSLFHLLQHWCGHPTPQVFV